MSITSLHDNYNFNYYYYYYYYNYNNNNNNNYYYDFRWPKRLKWKRYPMDAIPLAT